MAWDKEVDLLCAGSGVGGLAAAITGAEAGARALVAEKDTLVGGVQALSSGQIWLGGNRWAREAGIADSEDETIAYLEALSQGLAVAKLRETYVKRGQEALAFFEDRIGIRFQIVRDVPDYYFPKLPGSKIEGRYLEVAPFDANQLGDWAERCRTSPYGDGYSFTTSNEWSAMQNGKGESIADCLAQHLRNNERCAGAGLAAWMLKAALDRHVEIITGSAVTQLITEKGRVAGAVVTTTNGPLRVGVRLGVVLATSGYDWNEDLVRLHETMPGAGSMSPPSVTGDHFFLAAEVGAIPVPARAPAQTPIFIGYKVPGEQIYGHVSQRMLLPGQPHSIIVNRKGVRFANDAFYPDVATKVWRFDGQGETLVNWPAWLIFDDNFREKYSLLPSYPGQPLPEGVAVQADSLARLAQQTGIDGEGLAATVCRFNGYCETGTDPDFGRHSSPWGALMTGDRRMAAHPNFGPLERGPFYAVPLVRVVMGVATAGLRIDAQAQVINARGTAVPGLFAAGNAAAWLDIGGGYNSGIANMRGLLQGYLAASVMTGNNGPKAGTA
jgi:succinate dehydrogenase/fumarate reductase flavoprotein subunit